MVPLEPARRGGVAESFHVEKRDREFIVKTGGDLLNPYIGVTESLIRGTLEGAAAQGDKCVLLLDEADTFLRDRSKVRERWEASFTNEFLRQMKNFLGI